MPENQCIIQVQASDLRAALMAEAEFASRDTGWPTLNSIHVYTTDDEGWLRFAATDKYVMGTYRIPCLKPHGRVDQLWPLSDAKRLARIVNPGRSDHAVKMIIDDLRAIVSEQERVDGGNASLTITAREHGGSKFPPIRRMTAEHSQVSVEGSPPTSLDLRLFALFGRAQRYATDKVIFRPGPEGKPCYVSIGDYFAGLIAGLRTPDEPRLDEWATSL